jgi:glycosyltransferase involved in cell wall biosynthesis
MAPPVYLNGRFLRQPVTGVQRFSAEVTAAIDRLVQDREWPETVVLLPRSRGADINGSPPVRYERLALRQIGRTRGHLWEQTELPTAARGGTLVNLGNTAPMLAGSRQIVVIHDAGVFDTPESYSFRFRASYKALQRGLVRTGTHVVTVSKFSRDRIAARLGIDAASITVMYEGSDHILRPTADPGLLHRHGLRPRQFALVVGRRAAHKNLTALTEVATALKRRGIVIAYAGGGNSTIFRDTPVLASGEHELGRITDAELRALYENAVCLLFPSRYEGFGLPPVEAMACGCPVLASRGGAVEEICGDGALYFDTDIKPSVVAAVDRLLDENGLIEALRTRGLARTASLNWRASARVLGEALQRVQS